MMNKSSTRRLILQLPFKKDGIIGSSQTKARSSLMQSLNRFNRTTTQPQERFMSYSSTQPNLGSSSSSKHHQGTKHTSTQRAQPKTVTRGISPHNEKDESNLTSFNIIESTLREGEQFANAFFTTEQKKEIATMLDDFGVEYIEVTSPASSPQSFKDCQEISKLGLKKTKVLTHVRCHIDDAKKAVEAGVDGIDVVFGTSSYLREFSHGKDIPYIIEQAQKVITYIKEQGKEVRFSSEDSFRSDLVDLLQIYREVDKVGVNRVGIADTVGVANPRQVYKLVKTVRSIVNCDIEFHGHNDTGCAIANSFTALEAGCTHIDTSVLGIGERNGITPLGGFVARMYAMDPEHVKSKYNLPLLREIENYVAEIVEIQVPFNNYITGFCAFTHKAGIHAKAILNNPSTYEILKPEDFGMTRFVHIAHRLTGWNSIKYRADQLGLNLTDDQVKEVTNKIKELSDVKQQTLDDIDGLLRQYHQHIHHH